MNTHKRKLTADLGTVFCLGCFFVFPYLLTSLHPDLLSSRPFLLPSLPPYFLSAQSRLPKPSEVVKPRAYVSLESVPQGTEFQVAVVGEIMPGFHVNANQVHEDYLIPTTLQATLPPGLQLMQTKYPPGKDKKFPFSDKAMAVYDGSFTVQIRLKAGKGLPLGTVKLPLTLRYQACNDSACLPPVNLPVAVEIAIASTDTKPKATNKEIFSQR
jgi:hypothetical protein